MNVLPIWRKNIQCDALGVVPLSIFIIEITDFVNHGVDDQLCMCAH